MRVTVIGIVLAGPACVVDAMEQFAETGSSGTSLATTTDTGTGAATGAADSTAATSSDGSDTADVDFEPFACDAASPDVSVDRLCDETADPEAAPDKVYIHCRAEGSCLAPAEPETVDALVVVAYNVERGFHVDEHIALMQAGDVIPRPDVLLLSELDRGCARTDGRNIAWDYAAGLAMNHVYAVEFVELPRPGEDITAPCEHGNAILSRFPIGNVEIIRHETNKSWYDVVDEPRLGGRVAVVADILIGDRLLQLHSLHFESGFQDGPIRAAQAAELADLALARGTPAVIGGDTNAGLYAFDLAGGNHNEDTTEAFFMRGFLDAHIDLAPNDRATHDPGLVLDLVFTSGPFFSESGLCPEEDCGELSDHLPIWTTITLP